MMAGGGVGGVGGCTDCSGDVMFAWNMEDASDITSGTPCGCSDGDTTPTAIDSIALTNTQAKDGTWAANKADSGKYYEFDVSADDIAFDEEGKLVLWIWQVSVVNASTIFKIYGDANNYWKVYQGTGGDFVIEWRDSGSWDYCTLDSDSGTGAWMRLTILWKIGATPELSMAIDEDDNGTDEHTKTCSPGLAAWATGPTKVWIGGEPLDGGGVFYVDKITINATSGL